MNIWLTQTAIECNTSTLDKTNFRINETIFTLQTFVRFIEANFKTVKHS